VAATPASGTDTDTDSTPERLFVGGLGKYSHGKLHLVHQHWVSQARSAGSFDVHDTEAAEAKHKVCMVLPSFRVKHWTDQNRTHNDMVQYLLYDMLFRDVKQKIAPPPSPKRPPFDGVKKLLPVVMGDNLVSMDVQTMILHSEVRLARVELLDLLCFKLTLPTCRSSYALLSRLQWNFGQKYTTSDGQDYWGTDTQYGYSSSGQRRDQLVLHGSFPTKIRLLNGNVVKRQTALCCQVICFLRLDNMSILRHYSLPKDIKKEISDDSLILILVRWFEPHPTAIERDSDNFPMCPAPFDVNHALWQFAVTPKVRSVFIDPTTDQPTKQIMDQRCVFGRNEQVQTSRIRSESHAYYGFVKPSSIKCKSFMSPEFEYEKLTQSNTWLQTVSF